MLFFKEFTFKFEFIKRISETHVIESDNNSE